MIKGSLIKNQTCNQGTVLIQFYITHMYDGGEETLVEVSKKNKDIHSYPSQFKRSTYRLVVSQRDKINKGFPQIR